LLSYVTVPLFTVAMKQELERDEHSFGPDSAGFRIKQTQVRSVNVKS